MRFRLFLLGLIALLGLPMPRQASADMMYAIGDGGASLVRFSSDSPGSITRVGLFSGADSFLDAIDFRPSTGQLYGYRSATQQYVTVNVGTGVLTSATANPVGATTNTFFLGMDWNPTIDRLRVVTDSTQNIVYNPNTGTAAGFTALSYASGDVNAGLVPLVIDNAYTNNRPGAITTQQFVLDYDQNSLATLANNTGILSTVGQIKLNGSVLDFNEYSGFDISTSIDGTNTAYALLTVGGSAGLYTLDLTSANATYLGAVGSGFGPVYSLAVAPVPEPSSIISAGIGLGILGLQLLRRRRRYSK